MLCRITGADQFTWHLNSETPINQIVDSVPIEGYEHRPAVEQEPRAGCAMFDAPLLRATTTLYNTKYYSRTLSFTARPYHIMLCGVWLFEVHQQYFVSDLLLTATRIFLPCFLFSATSSM